VSGRAVEHVRLVVFDFDGVFTDNRVWVSESGAETVSCSRADGLGLRRLDEIGLLYLIVSTETNPVVSRRAEKLGAPCRQGVADKLEALREEAARVGAALGDVAYLGNDVNDVGCLAAVGLAIAPADAWPEARELAHWVTQRAGGHGCVREVCDVFWHSARIGAREEQAAE